MKDLEYDGRVFTFPFNDLIPDPDDDELDQLRESIRQFGVQNNILHTPDDAVVSGANRLVLAKELGIPLKDLSIKEVSPDDPQLLAFQMNTTGRKWPKDRLILAAHRLDRKRWSTQKIADALGVSQKTAWRYVNEHDDPEAPANAAVKSNDLTEATARPDGVDAIPTQGIGRADRAD